MNLCRRCTLTSQIITYNRSTIKCTTQVPSTDDVKPRSPSSWRHCSPIWNVERVMVAFQLTSKSTCLKTTSDIWASVTQAQQFGWETARACTNTPKKVSNAACPLKELWSLKIVRRYKRTSQHSESIDTNRSKKGSPWRMLRFRRSSNWWRIKLKRESSTWKRTKRSWNSTDLRRPRTRLRFLKFRFRLQRRLMKSKRNETKTSANDPKAFMPSKMTSVKQSKCWCLASTQVMTTTPM